VTIYLDNNATTRPLAEVVAAANDALERRWHNPSSVHRPGQEARQGVELARQSVARLINASAKEIVFTSGATESIGLAIRGVLAALPPKKRTIVTSPLEHEAVRDLVKALAEQKQAQIKMVPALRRGVIDSAALAGMLDESVGIVSIQWANNETGAVQPIDEIGRLCRERRIVFHSDATQWVGKMPADVKTATVDLLSFSAHKFHGPKGAGALWVRRGIGLVPQIRGVQEHERRGGTENVPGIVGMGAAAEAAMHWLADPVQREAVAALRDRFERGVLDAVPEASINGPVEQGDQPRAARLWNTTNIAFPKLEAEALLLLLSERGVCASAGAACSSGSLDPSPVLLAMGVPRDEAHGSLRFSLSRETTPAEIDRAIEIVAACIGRLRKSATSVA